MAAEQAASGAARLAAHRCGAARCAVHQHVVAGVHGGHHHFHGEHARNTCGPVAAQVDAVSAARSKIRSYVRRCEK